MIRPLLVLLLLFGPLAAIRPSFAAPARAGIAPPFGRWGEEESQLESRIIGAKAKIVEKRVLNGRDRWEVEGLIQPNLKRTIFYFRGGGLVEVELQYQSPQWIDSDYNSFLGELRIKIEQRLGDGKLIARSKTPVGNVTQTLVGYEWSRDDSAIELVYFAAESPSQVYRTVSLHYKSLE